MYYNNKNQEQAQKTAAAAGKGECIMPHSSYIRVVPHSRCAVVLFHGILGSPRQFDALLDCFPADWSVYNMLLDGHGGTVAEFAASGMERWQAQVDLTLEALRARHERIVIAAHSMGGLLALAAVLKKREQVAGMLLLAPALYIRMTPAACVNALRVALGRVRAEDPAALAAQRFCGVRLEKRLWRYLPTLPRFLELLTKARRVRGLLGLVEVPCTVLLSRRDELVGMRTARCLAGREGFAVELLEASGHFHFTEAELARIRAAAQTLVQRAETVPGTPE